MDVEAVGPMTYRLVGFAVAGVSAAAMLYVGLYQSRFVGRRICPISKDGCEGVADAPFARPFGVPDGYIGTAPLCPHRGSAARSTGRWVWIALLVLFGASRSAPTSSVCATG